MKVASIGECMIEIGVRNARDAALGFGGDTLNTAVYLARLGVRVDYVTALGDDPYSDAMLTAWREEGVGTGLVARVPGRVPGLYMIRLDAAGERTFHYWRDQAPARDLFRLPGADALVERLAGYDWIYFSGITLSILGPDGRAALHDALARARRRGGRVAFDGNYRARGWPSPQAAAAAVRETLAHVDLALPTFDDERALFDDADPAACARRIRAAGVAEAVVKSGAEGCWIADSEGLSHVPVERPVVPVDTTAAGDSFNAGYLAGRLAGLPPVEAARRGHRLAAAVIGHRGAIIPREAMPPPDTKEATP